MKVIVLYNDINHGHAEYEKATGWRVDGESMLLTIYTDKQTIACHAPGTWLAVMSVEETTC